MVNLTNHHRKAIAKVWDSRPIAEVLIEELAIVPASPPPPDQDWQLCTLHMGVHSESGSIPYFCFVT